jgi:hypothetical protein
MYLGGVVEDAGLGLGDEVSLMSGIEDQLAEVVSEASLVGFESLLTSVLASVVDSDADRAGELDTESSGLDFGEGEALTESGSVVVSDGLAADGGSEGVEGTGSDGGGSGPAGF